MIARLGLASLLQPVLSVIGHELNKMIVYLTTSANCDWFELVRCVLNSFYDPLQ